MKQQKKYLWGNLDLNHFENTLKKYICVIGISKTKEFDNLDEFIKFANLIVSSGRLNPYLNEGEKVILHKVKIDHPYVSRNQMRHLHTNFRKCVRGRIPTSASLIFSEILSIMKSDDNLKAYLRSDLNKCEYKTINCLDLADGEKREHCLRRFIDDKRDVLSQQTNKKWVAVADRLEESLFELVDYIIGYECC